MLLDKFDLLEDLKLPTLALDVVNVPFPKTARLNSISIPQKQLHLLPRPFLLHEQHLQ